MKDTDPVHFFSSEEIFDKAEKIFSKKKLELKKFLPVMADIQHVGACSVPGAIGKFDVDIQIRVKEEYFENVISTLDNHVGRDHPELWRESFAIFSTIEECQIDIMVTVINSKFDDFYKVRDYLSTHPDTLQEYNNLKTSYEGKPYTEYRKAKNTFLGKNGESNFLTR